jgi:trehalose-6-phosphate synthase
VVHWVSNMLVCCFILMFVGHFNLKLDEIGRQVSIRISHVGIDSHAFAEAAKSPAVQARAAEIRSLIFVSHVPVYGVLLFTFRGCPY